MKEIGNLGFSVAELLVTTVLLGLVLMGLHQAHLQQRRFTDWQQRVAEAHDSYRVANSLFAAEFREAVIGDGDVVLLADDSIAVRSPQGFAIVCAVLTSPTVLAFSNTAGTMPSLAADSLFVHTDGGWRAVEVDGLPDPAGLGVPCPFGAGTPEYAVEVDTGLADSVSVGAPVRVYRRYLYHAVQEGGVTWLARTDEFGTEALIGPLSPNGLRFRFLDPLGAEAADPAAAVATELRIIVSRIGATRVELRDTLVMLFQGRNR